MEGGDIKYMMEIYSKECGDFLKEDTMLQKLCKIVLWYMVETFPWHLDKKNVANFFASFSEEDSLGEVVVP